MFLPWSIIRSIIILRLTKEIYNTVNQNLCSSHQIKSESLATIVTPKYVVLCTPHHCSMKRTPNSV